MILRGYSNRDAVFGECGIAVLSFLTPVLGHFGGSLAKIDYQSILQVK